MAIDKGHRFDIEFHEAFGQGPVMVGEVSPDNECRSYVFRATGFTQATVNAKPSRPTGARVPLKAA